MSACFTGIKLISPPFIFFFNKISKKINKNNQYLYYKRDSSLVLEREGERESQRDRERDRETETETDRQTDRQRQKQSETKTDRQTDRRRFKK